MRCIIITNYELNTPLSEKDVKNLKVNDIIYLSGMIFTARDKAHERALEWYSQGKKIPIDFSQYAMYHCGPLVKKKGDQWELIAAGPTTSARMESFENKFISSYKIKMIIGKGGMGLKTATAMKENGAVYCVFTGGAAVLAAKAIQRIISVEWLDLGMAEALWLMEIKNFGPLIVAIDSSGRNIFNEIMKKVEDNRKKIYDKFGY